MKTLTLHPHVFHLAEAVNWPSIQRRGLLSARRLLAGASASPETNALPIGTRPMAHHRPESLVLPDGTLIRDQAPMPPTALARCLVEGITPAGWYALLNSLVFFWCDPLRLERQRRACGLRSQVALTLDAHQLLARYGKQAALTPFNTGYARRRAARRGQATFVPYLTWIESGWASETEALGRGHPRTRHHPPAELTIVDAVPDVLDFVVAVQALESGTEFQPHDQRHRRRSRTDHDGTG